MLTLPITSPSRISLRDACIGFLCSETWCFQASTGRVRRFKLVGCDSSRQGSAVWPGIPTSPTSKSSWTSRCLYGIGIASTERINSVPSMLSSIRGSGSHAFRRQMSPFSPRRSPATRSTWISSTMWPTRSKQRLEPLRRKAEAEPYPRRDSQIRTTTGLLDLGTDLTRDPTTDTPSRSGTTTTISGPTMNGRSGVGATKGGIIEMIAVAITAENERLAEAMAFCSIFSARGLMTSDAQRKLWPIVVFHFCDGLQSSTCGCTFHNIRISVPCRNGQSVFQSHA